MNIYLVERTDTVDWDEHDAFVVAAHSHQEAKRMLNERYNSGPSRTWSEYVESTLVGTAKATEPEVILGSFNAG